MTRSRWGLVGLAVAFYVYAATTARVGIAPYDDGVFDYGGWAVAHGRLPYRDFWTLYNPGQFLLLGAFFRYVTESVFAFRLLESAFIAATGLLAFDVSRRVYEKRLVAIAVGVVLTLWLGAGVALYPFHDNHTITSLFLVMLGADALLIGVARRKLLWFVLAGLAAGACFVVRQDAAPYVIIPELLLLAALPLFESVRWKDALRRAAGYLGGMLVPVAAMYAWVLSYAPHEYWQQAVLFPIKSNPALRGTPYDFKPIDFSFEGGLVESLVRLGKSAREGFFYVLPFVIVLLGIAVIVLYLQNKEGRVVPNMWGFTLLTFLLLVSLDYSRVRSDFDHIFGSVLLCFLVIPGAGALVAFALEDTKARMLAQFTGIVVGVFALLIPIAAHVRVLQELRDGVHLTNGALDGIIIDNRDAGVSANWDAIDDAAGYIAEHTAPDEEIVVVPAHTDRTVLSYPIFYVFAARASATAYPELYPSVTTTEETQQEMIDDMEATGVRYVIRWPVEDAGPCSEPNLSCSEEGSLLLDDYISQKFSEVARYDTLAILERR